MLGGGLLEDMRGLLFLLIDDSCEVWKPDRGRRGGGAGRLGRTPLVCWAVSLGLCAADPTQASQRRNIVPPVKCALLITWYDQVVSVMV